MRTIIHRVRSVKLSKPSKTKIVITTELMENIDTSTCGGVKYVRYARKVAMPYKDYWMPIAFPPYIAPDLCLPTCSDTSSMQSDVQSTSPQYSTQDSEDVLHLCTDEDSTTTRMIDKNDEVDLLCHEIPDETIEWAAAVME
jgi:hypothetical protein